MSVTGKRTNRSGGSILITTLWALIILAIIAVSLAKGAFSSIKFAGYLKKRIIPYYLARAGIKKAAQRLLEDENINYDSYHEIWGNHEEDFNHVPLGNGYFSVRHTPNNERENVYGLIDEESKININFAPISVLSKLIRITSEISASTADDIGASIIDWRDKDNKITKGGAEDTHYKDLINPYSCKNDFFESVEELLLVKGMAGSIFEKLQSYVTIFGKGGSNINTATPTVLEALGIESSLAVKIDNLRKGNDGILGSEDDNIFKHNSNILQNLLSWVALAENEKKNLIAITGKGLLKTKSDYFRIDSYGYMKSENSNRSISVVVERTSEKNIRIAAWHEE